MTAAPYQIKGLLENARSYATANSTYVWVGFFEEAANSPGVQGTGRVVMSVVASTDGTPVYGTLTPSGSITAIDPTRLTQVVKLQRLNNLHLNIFAAGTGTGTTFSTRPAASGVAQIGNLNSVTPAYPSATTFQYPVGSTATAQYTFSKAIQFNPRGEAIVDDSLNTLSPVVEIGLQPAHGTAVNTASPNVAVVQVTGVAGNVTVYRP